TQGGDQVIRLWDIASGKEIRQIGKRVTDKQPLNAVRFVMAGGGNPFVFSPDGKTLGAVSTEPDAMNMLVTTIRLYEVAAGKELGRLGDTGNPMGFRAFAPVGRFGGGGPQLVAFSPDGRVLAEGTSGGAVRLWDVAGGKEILHAAGAHHTGVTALAVAADGKT